ncbi:MAG: tetratricopeptide repeat protein [Planctomycetota bacterium]|nr:tetratricopeptide repeat protein [Planctomycetota bacterium]
MQDKDPPLAEQWRCLRQDLASARGYLCLLAAAVFGLASGAHARNSVWRDRGDLWLDITNKIYRQRLIDPATGQEAPRAARGRIYNNLGLYLYDQGRDLMRTRFELAQCLQEIAEQEKALALPMAQQRLAEQQSRQRDLLVEMMRLNQAILRHIPEEFVDACRRQGVREDDNSWDPFIPAELCLRKALYHSPTYYIAHLNLGLVYKLRAARYRALSEKRREYLVKAEELFRIAHGFLSTYGKALRYHAEVLADLGQYAEAAEIAERAAMHHDPAEGDHILRALLVHVIVCWLEAGKWDNAWRWYKDIYRAAEQDRVELGRQVIAFVGILKRDRRWREAETLLRDALSNMPDRAMAVALHERLVEVLCQAGDAASAMAIAKRLVRESPDSDLGWQALARCYLAQGDLRAASDAIGQALARAPGEGRALWLEAEILYREGKLETAIEKMLLVAQRLPNEAEVWGMLARLCLQKGLQAEADRAIKNALQLAPANAEWRALAEEIAAGR